MRIDTIRRGNAHNHAVADIIEFTRHPDETRSG